MSISGGETTRDAFLGGRLTLEQPARGYRAGVDPVILASFVPAKPGQSVLELGCGVGCALFCLASRVPGLDLSGVELQDEYATLARRNAETNGIVAGIYSGDLDELPTELRQRRFDHVIANPPYYAPGSGTHPAKDDRATAHREDLPLERWIAVGARRLAPRGMMSVIQRADRMGDLLGAMQSHLGSIVVQILQPRADRPASLVLVRGTKGGRAPLIVSAPIPMHLESTCDCSRNKYTDRLQSVLRNGQSLI
ncbi:tRNA1(Val) (adenine(37)-N6)-methyltransferase [Palleronia sp. LCG004]|uniref:tRNA1(Val) (adenine(37)-N6)-methyltransferase n=1 Tax=Palleronia sp. LCG004 TaxID=3079304 RepID=UPI002941BCDB|nr:methyltransferase [Palleronia sp. LCG004]WOI56371.1 methyltransferase [Palleronia sp. LCG004]